MRADRSSRRRGRSPGRGARCLRDPQLDPSVPRGGGEGVRDVPAQARPRNQGCVPTCRMTVARQTAEATPFRARLALTGRAGQRELTVVDQCDPTPSGCAPRRLDTSRRRPHGVRRSPSARAQRRPAQLRDARRNVDVADAPCPPRLPTPPGTRRPRRRSLRLAFRCSGQATTPGHDDHHQSSPLPARHWSISAAP